MLLENQEISPKPITSEGLNLLTLFYLSLKESKVSGLTGDCGNKQNLKERLNS